MTIYSSFYITGGTLPRDAPSYIDRSADHNLLDALRRSQFCYVLTSRQMGKSSLMVRTATRLRHEGIPCLVLDLTAIGQNCTEAQWYDGLLNYLAQQADLEDQLDTFWEAHPRLGPQQRFLLALQEVVLPACGGRLVLFIDEIDVVRSLTFNADGFFAAIRECYNRRSQDRALEGLTFCLMGVASPSDLIRDTRTTPFNIGVRIELTDFTIEEAQPLAKGLGPNPPAPFSANPNRLLRDLGGDIKFSPFPASVASELGKGAGGLGLLSRILYWTGGHPYLTQRLCLAVSEALASPTNNHRLPTTGLVDQLCHQLFLSDDVRTRDDNLLFVRERLLRSEVDRASLLDLYRRVWLGKRLKYDETNALMEVLRLSGIVREERGYLRVRNRIYARVFDRAWIATHMPDVEQQRQRAAYRLGLLRALAGSSVVVAVMASLMFAAIRNARRADEKTRLAQTETERANQKADDADYNLYVADLNLMQHDWQAGNIARLSELLEATRVRGRGAFEWGYWYRLCHLDLMTMKGHKGDIYSVAYSPDGKRIVTGSTDKTAKVWDVQTGQELMTLRGHSNLVNAVAFSPDDRRLITASFDNTARIWDSATGMELRILKGQDKHGLYCVAWSPDGKQIATGECIDYLLAPHALCHCAIWDAQTGKKLRTIKEQAQGFHALSFSPDGKRLAVINEDSMPPQIWDAQTGRKLLTIKGKPNTSLAVAFSPDGKRLIVGSYDNTAAIYDAQSGQRLLTLTGHTGRVWSVAFSPDGKRVATCSMDKTAKIWDAHSGKELINLKGHTSDLLAVAFSPDGKQIVTGSADHTAKIWDAVRQHEYTTLDEHTPYWLRIACSPDGKQIATCGVDNRATVWSMQSGTKLFTLNHGTGVIAVAYSPDSRRIVTGSNQNTAKVWDAQTGKPLLTLKGHPGVVIATAFSPDGKRILTADLQNAVRIWDAQTGKELFALPGDPGNPIYYIASAAYSPDGKYIAYGATNSMAGSLTASLRIWNAQTGKELPTLSDTAVQRISDTADLHYVRAVAFSPDSKHIAIGSGDNTARIWDLQTGKQLLIIHGHTGPVWSIAYSPDGKRLATGSWDNTAALWDAQTGRQLLTLQGFNSKVWSVAFSPDGKRLITGSNVPLTGLNTPQIWYSDPATPLIK
jgi:WD40 repeat protein